MSHTRVVLITGCSSGIGRALVKEFVRAGQRVVATARRPDSLADLKDRDVLRRQLDVTDPESIDAALTAALDWGGRVDILVNNAGFGLMGPVAELDQDELLRELDTNLVGPARLIRAVVPDMAQRGWGRIVNIGSVVGVTATPFAGAYCASKAGLHLLSDALRMEVAPFGIRVLLVEAGGIASNFADRASQGLERYRSPGSLYQPVASFIEARSRLSQKRPAPASGLARRVVRATLAATPPVVLRYGSGTVLNWVLRTLPASFRDRLLSRLFGLRRLRRRG